MQFTTVFETERALAHAPYKTRQPNIHAERQGRQRSGRRAALGLGAIEMRCHRQQVGNLPGIGQLDREVERFRRQATESFRGLQVGRAARLRAWSRLVGRFRATVLKRAGPGTAA